MHKYWKRLLWRFDRSFSTNRVWKPILWVVGFFVVGTMVLWLIGLAWARTNAMNGFAETNSRIDEVISLMIGQSNYPLQSGMPHWYQLLVAFVGTMFFTAFLISTFSNLLVNRAASHRKGLLSYYFENHVLILGGSKVVVGIVKSIAADPELRKKDVLIVANQDAEKLWLQIVARLSSEERKVSLTIYHRERNMERSLRKSKAELASVIYIVGEDNEEEHDSLNVECWERVKELREKEAKERGQCYLTFERNASTYLFHALPGEGDTSKMETTIVNRLESIAQQIMIGDDERGGWSTLDRGVIGPGSEKYVHLVVAGMNQMGYAMATTAAHLCHFPNFDENAERPIRTKITFVDKDADVEMKLFKGWYPGLFALSHSSYWENGKEKERMSPEKKYGDFLDVEWEYMKGELVDDWVREKLVEWKNDEKEVLTLALCDEEPERNVANALYLPKEYYRAVDERAGLTERDPLIMVYQPISDALVGRTRDVARYRNVIPFGMMLDSFDVRLEKRIAAAKRINYLYNNSDYVMMPSNEEQLNELWRGLSYANKMSNIYAANSIYTKFRSMKVDWKKWTGDFPEKMVEQMARMEHARWNEEKLLVGFSALEESERERIIDGLRRKDKSIENENNDLKKKEFVHKDIAPYDALQEASKEYDKAIVRHLIDVINV